MDPGMLPVATATLAAVIARQLNDDELALAASFFSQLGGSLAFIDTQRTNASGENVVDVLTD